MKQSELFYTTRKEAPRDEESKNAILLTRGGYIHKTMSGVYSFLPLGWRVMKNIMQIVREEMDSLPKSQEVLLSALQPLDLWRESGRLEDISDIMYAFKEDDAGLGPTHEEVVTDIFRKTIHSYKELPAAVYQIQTKFRHEARPKSGLLRGREFLMKDLYSFDLTEEGLDAFYELAKEAYFRVYQRCGLNAILTEASGGVFSKYSHEYQVISECGEDTIYLNPDSSYARNKEIVPDESDAELLTFCGGSLRKESSIEVGNIFKLNKKFSVPMQAKVNDEKGEAVEVWMGCYGIGISRIMGTVVEVLGRLEEKKAQIAWPESLAPYKTHIIDLTDEKLGQQYYESLNDAKNVLFDDRPLSAGEKFADADLIGAPKRIIVSKRSIGQGGVEALKWPNGESVIEPFSLNNSGK